MFVLVLFDGFGSDFGVKNLIAINTPPTNNTIAIIIITIINAVFFFFGSVVTGACTGCSTGVCGTTCCSNGIDSTF